MTTRIGYLGPEGTFTEEAVWSYVARGTVKDPVLVARRTIADVLLEVEAGGVHLGVVPAENSNEGSVAVTLDYLVHEVDLTITAEIVIPIRHSLLVLPGTDPNRIELVYSHAQALAQCRKRLSELLPGAEWRTCESTAQAARLVRDSNDQLAAAIGTELAGQLYDLEILARDLQDAEGNATRFLIVGHYPPPRTGCDKTSIVFAFDTDRAGNLYHALHEFAVRGINLTKLESRPAKRSLGDYLFFVDLEGHVSDEAVAAALHGLGRQCAFVRVLGSYPREAYPRQEE